LQEVVKSKRQRGGRLTGTEGAQRETGSLRRLLVFSWGHRTQRWIKRAGNVEDHSPLRASLPERHSGRQIAARFDTESEPSLRLLALTYGGSLSFEVKREKGKGKVRTNHVYFLCRTLFSKQPQLNRLSSSTAPPHRAVQKSSIPVKLSKLPIGEANSKFRELPSRDGILADEVSSTLYGLRFFNVGTYRSPSL
jgi:hypothetical protein